MTRNQLIFAFFTGLLLFVLYQTFLILFPFAHPIFWGGILAFGFYPLYAGLKRRMPGQETIPALISTLIIFLIFAPLAVMCIYNLTKEAIYLYRWIVDYIQAGKFEEFVLQLKNWPLIQRLTAMPQWEMIEAASKDWILNSAKSLGHFTAMQIGSLTKNVVLGIINFFLTFFLVFFFLRDGHKIYAFIYRMTPLEEETRKEVFGQITETFSAVIRGQLLTAIVQSVIAGVVFWVLGLPLPIFFAVLTFFTSLIPVLGAASVWMPFLGYLILIQQYEKAVALFLLGIVISFVDNILKPILIGQKLKLPYLVLFLGILGGLQVYGIMGIFLAPVVLSLLFVLMRIFREKFLESQDENRQGFR